MMDQKSVHPQKQDKHWERAFRSTAPEPLTSEDMHEMSMDRSCGCGMMVAGSIPNGIWYFY